MINEVEHKITCAWQVGRQQLPQSYIWESWDELKTSPRMAKNKTLYTICKVLRSVRAPGLLSRHKCDETPQIP
jgi:hypothetical protein